MTDFEQRKNLSKTQKKKLNNDTRILISVIMIISDYKIKLKINKINNKISVKILIKIYNKISNKITAD